MVRLLPGHRIDAPRGGPARLGDGPWGVTMGGVLGGGVSGVFIQADYGATGDGTTDDSAAFLAFQSDYVDSTDPVTLNLEPGSYVQGAHWMQGIDSLTVEGPATLADNRRVGTINWQRQSAMYSLRLDAVAQGDTVLTVKDVDPARLPAALGDPAGNPNRDFATLMALVSEGDWVILSAFDTQGFGFPTNPQFFEYAQVASVDAGAGTVTLTAPVQQDYLDTYPVIWNGASLQTATNLSGVSGTFQVGETVTASGGATGLEVEEYPSNAQGASGGIKFVDVSVANKAVAAGETLTGQTSGATATVVQTGTGLGNYRNFEADQGGPATLYVLHQDWNTDVTLRDLTWPTLSDAQASMAGRSITFENVDFSGMTASPNSVWPSAAKEITFLNCTMNSPEHDKLIETLTFRGGTAATHTVQSASIKRLVLRDHACNNIFGTPLHAEIRNTTVAGKLRIGALAYGRSESVVIENSSAGTLEWPQGYETLDGVTFDAGVFSKNDSTFGGEWAVPGTKIMTSPGSGHMTAIATIIDYSVSDGISSITTDLAALPQGTIRIYTHPCWDVTASANTGALAVLNGSVNQPLYSRGNLTAAGSMTLWGQLVELRINVTEAYAGNLSISGSTLDGSWTKTINMNHVGERVITADGVTGAQTGDDLTYPGWLLGGFTASVDGGAFSITATTDQEADAIVPFTGMELLIDTDRIDTLSGNKTLTTVLPFNGTHDLDIDWGDGTVDTGVTAANPSHTYSEPTTYTIRVSGTATHMTNWTHQGDSRAHLLAVTQWGDLGITNYGGAFWNCSHLADLPDHLPEGATNIEGMLRSAIGFNDPNVSNWTRPAGVTSLMLMFAGCSSFNQDVTGLVTAGVNNIQSFLSGAAYDQSTAGWDTSNVSDWRTCFKDTPFDGAGLADVSWAGLTGSWNLQNFAQNCTFATANYDALLQAWDASGKTGHQPNVGASTYTAAGAGGAARENLIAKSWTITDGGGV